jgi:hypothetical protein
MQLTTKSEKEEADEKIYVPEFRPYHFFSEFEKG